MELKNLIITLTLIAIICCPHDAYAEQNYYKNGTGYGIIQEDFSEYMQTVKDKLSKFWLPPDFMEEGHVNAYFKLNRQGRVVDSGIIESSGNNIYDESALDAINKAAPYGEFPRRTSKEYITIKYSFDTFLIEDERIKEYFELAKFHADKSPQKALKYLDMAIAEIGGEEDSYFLYKRRADIKKVLRDINGAKSDYDKYDLYTKRANIKRVHLLKHLAETQGSSYIYHYLAYAYEQIGDFENAKKSINKAIEMNDLNIMSNLKRYKKHLEDTMTLP